jgi:glucose-1-phosphate thymidylyltransferase
LRVKVLVLAGGSGREMEPLTRGEPKAFLRIIGRSLISHVVSRLIASNYREIYIVSDRPEKMEREIGDYKRLARIEVIEQKGRGVEAALLSARDRLKLDPGERFLLVYGDIVVNPSAYISTYMASMEEGFEGSILAVPEPPLPSHGIVEVDELGRVIAVKQASQYQAELARYISGGIYALDQTIFDLTEELGDIVAAYNKIASTKKIKALFWGHYWINVGTPWDLLAASYHMLSELDRSYISSRASIAKSTIVEGPVIIDDEASIDHNVVLKGPLYIGKEVFIGANTFIRNSTSIEEGAIIGSYSEINRSLVMNSATIGRGSYIGYSVIGEKAVVEPNTITWNIAIQPERRGLARGREYAKIGCVVGKGSRVKAGSIINPGEIIT